MTKRSDPKFLLQKIREIFLKVPSGLIKVNSFWNFFIREHHWMPKPNCFGVSQRSQLLRLFPEDLSFEVHNNETFVCLKAKAHEMSNRSNKVPHENPVYPPQQMYPFGFPPQFHPPPSINLEKLNKEAQECIDIIAENKEYVCCHEIEQRLLQKHGIASIQQLGIMGVNQLQCVQQLLKVEAMFNITVQGFISRRSVCTLYDLELCIIDLLNHNRSNRSTFNIASGSSFEDLKLGPLNKQPVICHLFKVPQDKPIFELTTLKLLSTLVEYLNQKHKWNTKVDVEEFMDYVKKAYRVQDAIELGVKITNFSFLIQTVKRMSNKGHELVELCIENCENELRATIGDAFLDFRKMVLSTMESSISADNNQLKYNADTFKKSPTDIVKNIFSKLHYLFVKIQEHSQKYLESNKTRKILKDSPLHKITSLREFLQKDDLVGQVFHIALCCSHDQIVCELGKVLGTSDTKALPPKLSALSNDEVIEKMLKYLENCFENGSLSLGTLAKIEEKIVADMQLTSFGEFYERGFISFLVDTSETKELLEEHRALSLGSSMISNSAFRASSEELKDFVRQCLRFSGAEKSKTVKKAICNHYKVSSIKEVGVCGSMKKVIKSIKEKNDAQPGLNNVVYESALLGKYLKVSITSEKKIGLHGSMSRDQALLCLHNCPLLCDLSKWSNWDLVFRPEHGDLKSFLRQNGGVQQVVLGKQTMQVEVAALETIPGTLLKLRTSSNIEDFEKGVKARDPAVTCGHLVSCLVNQGGANYFSEELFANKLKTSLLESGEDESRELKNKNIINFILECLFILPDMVSLSLSQKVFLEPINEVLGNSKSKELLLKAAQGDIQRLNKLEFLGLAGGISIWFEKSFEAKLAPKELEKLETKGDISSSKKRKRTRMSYSSGQDEDDQNQKSKVFIFSNDSENKSLNAVKITPLSKKLVQNNVELKPAEVSGSNEMLLSISHVVSLDSMPNNELMDMDLVSKDSYLESFNPNLKLHWQLLVNDIRRNEFGMGVGLNKDGEELLKKQQDRLGRSLERLSIDLYSRDTHFLLELVQNADDNQYPANDSSVPSLQFRLCKDVIIVLNNEAGFRDIDLRAICDVGRTTKGQHKQGYIGQKGIGFKSVFRISDQPEVHSRGLHIKFDLNSGSLGYILPHWIGLEGSICSDMEALKDSSYTTKFVLPMKKAEHTQGIQSKFEDIHPTLLLFLHRLKQITIHDEIKGKTTNILRRDLGDNVTEILHNGVSERWIFIKKVVDASEVSKEAKSGIDVKCTELAMAFPIAANLEKEQQVNQQLPPKQPLFAFLPLRSYGFRFIIHADFDVPSSREDVIDNLWNQWLRSKIHLLFLEALEYFKSKRDCDPVVEICNFFKFLPQEDEILDFFRQVALNINTNLKISRCLPSADSHWCYPSQLVMCDNPAIKSFVTSDLLFLQTGLSYLHPLVARSVDRSILLDVGVQLLGTNHLVQVGKGMMKNIHKEVQDGCHISDSHIQQIYTWLSCIYKSLDELSVECCDVMESLKNISLIPLSNGQLVSMDYPTSIFFPFSSNAISINSGNSQLTKRMIKMLEEDINSVDSRMFSMMEEQVSKSQVINILEKLGVRKLSDEDLVRHHILHSLKDEEKVKTLSKELLIVYTVCLKNYFMLHPSFFPTSQVVDNLVVLTCKGMVNLNGSSIYFSTDYNSPLNLQQQLPGFKWTMLDNCYLSGNKSLSNVLTWRDFFSHLGIKDFLSFKKETITFNKEALMSSPWRGYMHLLDGDSDTCVVEDWICKEFKELVSMDTSSSAQHQMKNLFNLVNKFWEPNDHLGTTINLSKFAQTVLKVKNTGHVCTIPSNFGFLLKTSKWVPVWKIDSEQKRHLFITIPSVKIIAESKEALSLFGSHVQYATIKSENFNKDFAEFIGIKLDLDPLYVSRQLIDWSLAWSGESGIKFQDASSRMANIYNYLEDSLSKAELVKLVTEHPVIYCPSKVKGKSFLHTHEVCWQDDTELIEKYSVAFSEMHNTSPGDVPRVLSIIYPASKKDFFVRICNVPLCPSISSYAHILLQASSINTADEITSTHILRIFAVLEQSLLVETPKEQIEKVKTILNIVKDRKFIPNKAGRWMSLSENPIIANNKQFERMFPSCANYVNVGDGSMENCNRNGVQFLYRLGVPRLTDMVELQPVKGAFQPCLELQAHVKNVIPYIQRCLYFEFPQIYKHLVEKENIVEKLAAMKFGKVEKLELVYQLKCGSSNHVEPPRLAELQKSCHVFDGMFCIQEKCINDYFDINRELASYISQSGMACPPHLSDQAAACFKELRSLLSEITPSLRNNQETILNDMLEERSISRLPSSEVPWFIAEINSCNLGSDESCPAQNLPMVVDESLKKNVDNQEIAGSKHQHPKGDANWPINNQRQFRNYIPQNFQPPMPIFNGNSFVPYNVGSIPEGSQQSRQFQYPPCISSQQVPMVNTELPKVALRDDLDFRANNCQDPDSIGMWGERLVYDYFLNMAQQPDSDINEVVHVNENGFTSAPFDIVLKRKNGECTFVEVKSSMMQDKTWFETSIPELQFALEKEEGNYQVYRVFGVGREASNVRITKIENFKEVICAKHAKLIVVFGDQNVNPAI